MLSCIKSASPYHYLKYICIVFPFFIAFLFASWFKNLQRREFGFIPQVFQIKINNFDDNAMWLFDSLQIVLGNKEEDQKTRQVLF